MGDDETVERPTYVVYTLDEDLKPGHFLAVVDSDELEDAMGKWWKAFHTGEKEPPKNYNGISHRPVAQFDRWADGE
ncbi:hypothetical protein [Natrinema versiforme]|uniref:Uncharacterized protein n=1 Tax=Natrinema versiforme JCM 10478 TaxID=1227496 RepID=L9Y5H3_9EURY|nr:hypothetical protein [Natrinema versiforme]ELY68901.1 hypothetical protein C489_06028 [Natrinema versiforme JCM 10478]